MLHRIKVAFVCLSMMAASCKDKTDHDKVDKADTYTQLRELNKSTIQNKITENNAIPAKDSTIKYTYQLQEKINVEKRPIAFIGDIIDIVRQDSGYLMIVKGEFNRVSFTSEISITPFQLRLMFGVNNRRNKGCFIFHPSFDVDKRVFKGTLIDFYLERKELPVDDD